MTMTANGYGGGTAGTDAMKLLTHAERMRRHDRMIRFLDSGDAAGMTCQQIADAAGISRAAVYSEFVKRKVPMTQGQKATYSLPASTPKGKGTPHGKAKEKIQAYLETGGGGTMTEIAEATGVPRSTVVYTLAKMGLVPGRATAPEPAEPPVTKDTVMAEVEAMVATTAAGDQPEGKLAYLHQLADGRHAALDLLTGRLWEMEATRPL